MTRSLPPLPQRTRRLAAALVLLLVAGCSSRPQAPALHDEPVYQNDREGFRFLVPEGWTIHGKGEVPPGKQPGESLLVHYDRLDADRPAFLEVTAADFPESTDLAAQVAGPSYGIKNWRLSGPPEHLDVGGVPGDRFVLAGNSEEVEMTKEVVTFRRGERVYLFTGFWEKGDASARTQVRKAVESTIWKR